MTDGQLLALVALGAVVLVLVGLAALEAWIDRRTVRRNPAIRGLRSRTHDNAAAALDGHRGVSTRPVKEQA